MKLKEIFLPAVACLVFLSCCTAAPDIGITRLRAASLEELGGYLLKQNPDLDLFKLRGPFAVTVRKDFEIRLPAPERIVKADLYLSAPISKAPLIILMHGYDNSKEDHAYQAMHLASWGIHSLALQLPNKGPWIGNGNLLARIAKLIQARPEIVDSRIDPAKIILAGHSFGASSVAIALAEGAPAVGGILLDPAGSGRTVPLYLRRIRTPVISLNSDERVTLTRNRGFFYMYIPSDIATVSITGAAHEDAQFPMEAASRGVDADLQPDEEHQLTYVSALTAAALSFGVTGKMDYAWKSYSGAIHSGKMFGEMRK